MVPGTISLSVARKMASSSSSRDAVVALAGGPGQAALPLAEFIAQAIAPALTSRDLLVFDQRGTGTSDPLNCTALTSAVGEQQRASITELLADCAAELGPARGSFTTSESVADIEALREAFGYEKLVLYGTSYGTKVALEYAERYPEHVEALVLDSTETPEGPEPFHLSTFKAMTPVLQELCSRNTCAKVTVNPVTDLARLVQRLGNKPITGHAYNEHGKSVAVDVTISDVYALLLAGDLNPGLRAEMPAAVRAAIDGDPSPLLYLVELSHTRIPAAEESEGVDLPLFFDTSCEETPFPWQRGASELTRAVEAEATLDAVPASDFYPFGQEAGFLNETIPLCVGWPNVAPPPPAQAPLPNVPTLILSGRQDLRTPTENARSVAARIPDAELLTVPYTGHSVIGSDFSGCAGKAVAAFFAEQPVEPCAATVDRFPPAPLAPISLAKVTPLPRLGGIRGSTAAATVESIRDLRRTVVDLGLAAGGIPAGIRFGGLLGGSVTMTKTTAVLSRFSYVPGVQLSGVISDDLLLKSMGSAASLIVGGSAAAGGHVRISSSGKLEGVLSGERFSVHVSAKAKQASATQASEQAEWPAASIEAFPMPALARLR